MIKRLYKIIGVLLLTLVASLSHAADLMDIYKDALENDPIFKEAYSTYMSTREAVPQARAALYPQASASASTATRTTRRTPDAAGSRPPR